MSEVFLKMTNMSNNINPAPQKPTVKRKGGVMSVIALIMGIVSMIASGVTFWFVFWFAYGRMNTAVILTSSLSMLLGVVALAAITLSIIAKVRGAHTGMLVATIITSCLAFPALALNLYILIYYIGTTY